MRVEINEITDHDGSADTIAVLDFLAIPAVGDDVTIWRTYPKNCKEVEGDPKAEILWAKDLVTLKVKHRDFMNFHHKDISDEKDLQKVVLFCEFVRVR